MESSVTSTLLKVTNLHSRLLYVVRSPDPPVPISLPHLLASTTEARSIPQRARLPVMSMSEHAQKRAQGTFISAPF